MKKEKRSFWAIFLQGVKIIDEGRGPKSSFWVILHEVKKRVKLTLKSMFQKVEKSTSWPKKLIYVNFTKVKNRKFWVTFEKVKIVNFGKGQRLIFSREHFGKSAKKLMSKYFSNNWKKYFLAKCQKSSFMLISQRWKTENLSYSFSKWKKTRKGLILSYFSQRWKKRKAHFELYFPKRVEIVKVWQKCQKSWFSKTWKKLISRYFQIIACTVR